MIIYFAGSPYDGVAGTDRHMADRLSSMTSVLYVDPPISALTPLLRPQFAESMRGPALRKQAEGLWRLIPRVLPGAYRPGMHRVTQALTRRAARRAARRLGARVSAVVVATYDDLLGAVPGARTLFYATDDLIAGADLMGLPRRRLAAARDRRLAEADEVAVVSPLLRDQFRELGREAAIIPNGCAPAAYAGAGSAPRPGDLPPFDRPAAGFIGNINARIDLSLLEAVAGTGHPLLIVGPHDPAYAPARFRDLTGRPNVHWTGRKAFSVLPGYLGAIHVGLTPYVDDAFNRASFPIKTLEYLAAGRGAVSTCLPATQWLRSAHGGADLIRSESSARGFVQAVEAELAVPSAGALVARRRAFAEHHDWAHRARALAGLLGLPGIDLTAQARQEVPGP